MTLQERHIPLAGAKNFRDFGGYAVSGGGQVRRGVLYRSDKLSQLTEEDLEVLAALEIRHICDLRRHRERELSPTRWHPAAETRHLHMPLISDEGLTTLERVVSGEQSRRDPEVTRQIMIALYRRLVTESHPLQFYRQMFELVAGEDGVPVLIHCSGGKDRTGISCALILWALGVSMDDIMADYLLSHELYTQRLDFSNLDLQAYDHGGAGDWNLDAIRPVYSVEPAYLESALGYVIDRYRDPESFVREALGLGDEVVERVRERLVE